MGWSSQSWNSLNIRTASLRAVQTLIHIQCLSYCCQRQIGWTAENWERFKLAFPCSLLLTSASNIMNNDLNTNKCSDTDQCWRPEAFYFLLSAKNNSGHVLFVKSNQNIERWFIYFNKTYTSFIAVSLKLRFFLCVHWRVKPVGGLDVH